MSETFVAIEIENHEVWNGLCVLQPHFKELDADFNIGNFVIISPGELEGAIVTPETIAVRFDHLTPNELKFKTVNIVK